MKIYLRILSVFSLCILCTGVAQSDNVTTDGKTVKQTAQGQRVTSKATSQIDHSYCKGKKDDDNIDCTRFVTGFGASRGVCKNNLCKILECDSTRGRYYVAFEKKEKGKTFIQAQGFCVQIKCPGGLAPQTEIVPKEKWQTNTPEEIMNMPVVVKDLKGAYKCFAEGAPCTESMLSSLHATEGIVKLKPGVEAKGINDFYCRPTKCEQDFTLINDGQDNATCCKTCHPINADCPIATGHDVGVCEYSASCWTGYDKLTGEGSTAPQCTPKEYGITYILNPNDKLEDLEVTSGDCSPKNYTYNEETIINCAPTSNKYDFIGWYTEDDPTNYAKTRTIGKNATGPITFYAKWGEKDCDKKSYPGGDAEQKCICTERKTWDGKTCDCGKGFRWDSTQHVCIELKDCEVEGIPEAHANNYKTAIELIKNAYKEKANEIIAECKTKPGYIDKDRLECVEIGNAE